MLEWGYRAGMRDDIEDDGQGELREGALSAQAEGVEIEALPQPGPIYAWVDSNPPPPDRAFSAGRAMKLFVAILISSVLAGLPLLLFKVGLLTVENAKKEELRQEQLKEDWKKVEKAVREGKAGEATRRLFGVEEAAPRKPREIHPNDAERGKR
jgi:hypothetical protein